MTTPLHVLLVESDLTKTQAILAELRKSGYKPIFHRVETEAEYIEYLSGEPDIIIACHTLPNFAGIQAMQLLHESELDVPFIVVAEALDDETAIEYIRLGASDYVLQTHLSRLGTAVIRALNDRQLRAEKQHAEVSLRESQERYRQMVEVSPDLIWIQVDNQVVFINQRGAQLLGADDTQDIVGNHVMNLIHPDYRALANRRIQLLERGIQVPFTEERLMRLDGAIIDLEIVAVPSIYAGRPAIQVIGRDQAERKRAEQALHESEEKFSAVFRESLDAIIIVDAASERIFSVNPASQRVLGYDKSDLLDQHYSILFPPESQPQGREFVERLQTYGSVLQAQTFVRSDGIVIPMDLTATLIPWDQGKAIVVTLRDVSERLQFEAERVQREALQVALEHEKEIGQLRNRFMSIVSHEFRTPLAVILTSSELLERYSGRLSQERQDACLKSIKKQVRHLGQMLDDVSMIVRAESGRLDFKPVPLDLTVFCQEVLDDIRTNQDITHSLILDVEGNFRQVLIDNVLLGHALKNLIGNAMKYSPPGSEIQLRLKHNDDQEIIIEVSDNGIGIPEADQQRLFDAYFRASNVGNVNGTGLGLRIVHDSVVLHGGRVAVESTLGKGSTFIIYLPTNQSK